MSQVQVKDQTKRDKKYDRQIRLWGHRGQKNLTYSRIALINCTGVGIEALKNLILPGVGYVDIWDNSNIQVSDLSTSFFFQQSDVGESKAKVASKNLLQMNPDVKGSYFVKGLNQFLQDQKAIKSYNLVIFGGSLSTQQLITASKRLWQLQVPCIFVTVVGFFFYIRAQKHEHFVQFSNTNVKKFYLRISNPTQQLENYLQKHNIYKEVEKLANTKQQNQRQQILKAIQSIPYSLILTATYKKLPQNEKKPNFISKQLEQLCSKIPFENRKNVQQSQKFVFQTFQTIDRFMIDSQIFNCRQVKQCSKDSSPIVKFLYACKQILQKTGQIPQPLLVPDMTASTKNFVGLKNIYKQHHQQDIKKILEIMKTNFGEQSISEAQVSQYINNLYKMQLLQIKKYAQQLENPDTSMLNWLSNEKNMLISVKTFQDLYKQNVFDTLKYQEMKQHAYKLKQIYKIQQFDQRYLKEVFRSKGKTNINISSMAGAIIGQQAIKIVTGCFTPMNSGYFFDGANGRGYQVKL